MLKVGFIGLGTMGFPIAGHISKSYKTLVFNRTTNKSQKQETNTQAQKRWCCLKAASDKSKQKKAANDGGMNTVEQTR